MGKPRRLQGLSLQLDGVAQFVSTPELHSDEAIESDPREPKSICNHESGSTSAMTSSVNMVSVPVLTEKCTQFVQSKPRCAEDPGGLVFARLIALQDHYHHRLLVDSNPATLP